MSIMDRIKGLKKKRLGEFLKKTPIQALHQTLGFFKENLSKTAEFAKKGGVKALHSTLNAWNKLMKGKEVGANVAVQGKGRND